MTADTEELKKRVAEFADKWDFELDSLKISQLIYDLAEGVAELDIAHKALSDIYLATTTNPKGWTIANLQHVTRPYAKAAGVNTPAELPAPQKKERVYCTCDPQTGHMIGSDCEWNPFEVEE